MFTIRPAQPGDASGIEAVHRQAFPTDAEARLVALLIGRRQERVSLVAEVDSQVVGHLLFSSASIERPDQTAVQGLGLAPLAVVPQFQRQGIGSALMRAGMQGLPRKWRAVRRGHWPSRLLPAVRLCPGC